MSSASRFLHLVQAASGGAAQPPAEEIWEGLEAELRAGLSVYWNTAGQVLAGSGIRLTPPGEDYFSLPRNFFSALFLYAYWRAALAPARRTFYVAVNQCLRGMVTGCDNLLDDEYKATLETDLPAGGTRFRSVLDIMVSDRVLFQLLTRRWEQGEIALEAVRRAAAASLAALAPSGAQEAGEQPGVDRRLPPAAVLRQVHHFKTAMLFQCTWAVPEALGDGGHPVVSGLKAALYDIGMGCQVLDDMVDLLADVRGRRHNYVASLVAHGPWAAARDELARRAGQPPAPDEVRGFLGRYPDLGRGAWEAAQGFLERGLLALFAPGHRFLAAPSAAFIAARIGAHRLVAAAPGGTA